MAGKTAIEWTDVTDNIIVAKIAGKILGWWCRMISPGCLNCYAAKLNLSKYFKGNNLPYSGEPPELHLRQEIIDGWARQTKPKKHFVSSMTDVFGEWVKQEWIFSMLDGMAAAPKQTFQVLTKRPDVALSQIDAWLEARGLDMLPPNIQIGTSVEDQMRAALRVPILLKIRAHIRFLSCEPLLSAVDVTQWMHGLHWIVCGGESGKNARPMHLGWARSLRDQAKAAGVAFFFKQWGEWAPLVGTGAGYPTPVRYWDTEGEKWVDGISTWAEHVVRLGKKLAGSLLDGVEYKEFPQLKKV